MRSDMQNYIRDFSARPGGRVEADHRLDVLQRRAEVVNILRGYNAAADVIAVTALSVLGPSTSLPTFIQAVSNYLDDLRDRCHFMETVKHRGLYAA